MFARSPDAVPFNRIRYTAAGSFEWSCVGVNS